MEQNEARKSTSILSSDIQAANDFVSAFDEILLYDSPYDTSSSSPHHPDNCCLCSLTSSGFFDPLDATTSPVPSSDNNKICQELYSGLKHRCEFDEENSYSEDTRQGDMDLSHQLKIPLNYRRAGDVLRKKSLSYFKFLSTHSSLGKCEICYHWLKSACRSFLECACVAFVNQKL